MLRKLYLKKILSLRHGLTPIININTFPTPPLLKNPMGALGLTIQFLGCTRKLVYLALAIGEISLTSLCIHISNMN